MSKRAPRARQLHAQKTQKLALVTAQGQSLGLKDWTPKHLHDVGLGLVDKKTVKGIWHGKDEAWAGIDDVLPTDTPYSYELDHVDYGNSAKLTSYIDHVRSQLRQYEQKLAAAAKDPKAASLLRVLKSGEKALDKIEGHVRKDEDPHALKDPAGPQIAQLRQVAYPLAGAAYATERLEKELARAVASGMRQALQSQPSPAAADAAAAAGAGGDAKGAGGGEGGVTVTRSESCSLCIEIFGCPDCCQPVCDDKTDTHAARAAPATKAPPTAAAGKKLVRGHARGDKSAAARRGAAAVLTPEGAAAAAAAVPAVGLQGLLGAYGENSDDSVWPQREPAPGKSEQVAAHLSGLPRALLDRLRAARASEAFWRRRYAAAAAAARRDGREVSALERQQVLAARAGVAAGEGVKWEYNKEVALPYYEIKGQGARRAVRFYEQHPAAARREMAGRPVLSSD